MDSSDLEKRNTAIVSLDYNNKKSNNNNNNYSEMGSASNSFFLASAYEGERTILSIAISSSFFHCTVSVFMIAEVLAGVGRAGFQHQIICHGFEPHASQLTV